MASIDYNCPNCNGVIIVPLSDNRVTCPTCNKQFDVIELNDPNYKHCPRCNETKPITDFYFIKQRKRFEHWCKKCKCKYMAEYYIKRKNILCVNCNEKLAEINHHINYAKDIKVPVCRSCEKLIHNDPNHPLFPVDSRASSKKKSIVIGFRASPKLLEGLENSDPQLNTSEKIRRLLLADLEVKKDLRLLSSCVETTPNGKNYLRIKKVFFYDG